jgi:AAA+ superfamily predicted ATPase
MTTAVGADPGNVGLRLHLATLLLDAGRGAEALEACRTILSGQPDHLEALSCAARAAEAAGDSAASIGYRKLYDALGWKQTKGLLDEFPDHQVPNAPSVPEMPSLDDRPSPQGQDNGRRVPLGRYSSDDDKEDDGEWEIERPGITLADVAGMEEVKRRLNLAFLAPLKNPDMMRLYGKSLRGGLLLYGPPGCGKTYVARATAGELGAKFLSVGLSDVLDMWMGESERKLHEIFETARRSKPCVLFFDEIDALGRKRSLMRNSAGRDVVNQLLAEMDSVQGNNDGVFILAATNHPWDVDTALRRPGRLDRTLLVLPPDSPAREAMLRSGMRNRPTLDIDIAWLASRTDGYSGADVAHLCESAAELALEESLTTGRARPISMNDFRHAIKEIKPSVRPWFDTARNYALFANEGGAYDELANYLRSQKLL